MNSDDTDDRDSTVDASERNNGTDRVRTDESSAERSERSLASNRTTVIVAGALLAALGILAILAPQLTGITLSLVLGALLVISSLAHVAAAFSAKGWHGSVFGVVLAALYGVAGIALLANPVLGLAALTLLLGVYFLADGLVQLVMGLRVRTNDNWGWLLISGVVSVFLSSLILLGFPSSAAWAVGLLFGVNLLTSGVALAMLGTAARAGRETGAGQRVGESRTGSS
ncbi:HdeD family acid-resistance protein [Halorientalis halophila]|uniref:HdeD family acid-resistance protein n=1 Tax=Halorientalis halophila TaxID=3108499 RepID=UPI003009CA9A